MVLAEWRFKVLYDGECPFCRIEAKWLSSLGRDGQLIVEDIATANFNAARYGTTLPDLMGTLYGVYPDGSQTRGMETFRAAYRAVGLGWLLAPTGWPFTRPLFDLLYRLFAHNRVRMGFLFGRGCKAGRCAIPPSKSSKR